MHWHQRLEQAGVPSGVVKPVLDVVREAAASALTGMPPSIGAGGGLRFPPPRLDEHGPVVRSLGWGAFGSQGPVTSTSASSS
jgi:hypothetical protein